MDVSAEFEVVDEFEVMYTSRTLTDDVPADHTSDEKVPAVTGLEADTPDVSISSANLVAADVADAPKLKEDSDSNDDDKKDTLGLQSVFSCIDMSVSMVPYISAVCNASRTYYRCMVENLPANTMFDLWYFHKDNIAMYEGLLRECDIEDCIRRYEPDWKTGLYRVQFYAIERMVRIQKAAAKGVHMPFIMTTMTDGKNNHSSGCQGSDVVRVHANNVDIDRSLMVVKGMNGEKRADELNIPRERLTVFGS